MKWRSFWEDTRQKQQNQWSIKAWHAGLADGQSLSQATNDVLQTRQLPPYRNLSVSRTALTETSFVDANKSFKVDTRGSASWQIAPVIGHVLKPRKFDKQETFKIIAKFVNFFCSPRIGFSDQIWTQKIQVCWNSNQKWHSAIIEMKFKMIKKSNATFKVQM